MCLKGLLRAFLLVSSLSYGFAQQDSEHQHQPEHQQEHDHHNMGGSMPGMHHAMNRAGMYLMNVASGTARNPAAAGMPMIMTKAAKWNLMWMGTAFLVDTQQSGPRGGDKLYSPNWFMLGAEHALGRGSVLIKSMLSLEPATITDRRYPLLFQTGETAYGLPLADAQHPHNLFMELSVQYARPLGEKTMWNIYYAPVGDPALGPVAFPHRSSASELPQATLSHHWEDSTHIAYQVVTMGLSHGMVKLEASGFHGAEPGENRWTIAYGGIDSWSARLSVTPTRNWMGQLSVGRLSHPEATTPGDVVRTTASLHYSTPGPGEQWSTSAIWGRNYKTFDREANDTFTLESVKQFRRKNFVTGRFEWSQRDELFEATPELEEQVEHAAHTHTFPITAYTLGYTRDVDWLPRLQTGVGANFTTYGVPSAIQPYYGSHPIGVNVYMRLRIREAK